MNKHSTQHSTQMTRLVEKFRSDLTDIFMQEVEETVQMKLTTLVSDVMSKSVKAKPNGSRKSKPNGKSVKAKGETVKEATMKVRARKKGKKRTPAQLADDTKKVLAAIVKEPGLNAEGLRDRLGIPTKDLKIPLAHLFENSKIAYEGQARGTRYYPA